MYPIDKIKLADFKSLFPIFVFWLTALLGLDGNISAFLLCRRQLVDDTLCPGKMFLEVTVLVGSLQHSFHGNLSLTSYFGDHASIFFKSPDEFPDVSSYHSHNG